MRNKAITAVLACALLLGGCSYTPPSPQERTMEQALAPYAQVMEEFNLEHGTEFQFDEEEDIEYLYELYAEMPMEAFIRFLEELRDMH